MTRQTSWLAGALLLTWCSAASAQPTGISSTSATAVNPLVAKAFGGNLYSFDVVGGSAGFIMVFDSTTAPSNGAVTPKFCANVLAGGYYSRTFPIPLVFGTGITLVYSTGANCSTLAAAVPQFMAAQVQ